MLLFKTGKISSLHQYVIPYFDQTAFLSDTCPTKCHAFHSISHVVDNVVLLPVSTLPSELIQTYHSTTDFLDEIGIFQIVPHVRSRKDCRTIPLFGFLAFLQDRCPCTFRAISVLRVRLCETREESSCFQNLSIHVHIQENTV